VRAIRLGARERHRAGAGAGRQDRHRPRRADPRRKPPGTDGAAGVAAAGGQGGRLMDGTVLIADDDRGIRIVLTQALTRAGCRVHATGSLAQLMRWVEEGAGDLVITDVMMPDGNGLDLIPAIARARPDLPVIVISAQNSIVTAIRATEAAVFDYLPKPFDLPELMARVRAGLERRRQRTPAAPTPAPAPAPAP